jgi:general L-amino acid transport system substrate-binding protein
MNRKSLSALVSVLMLMAVVLAACGTTPECPTTTPCPECPKCPEATTVAAPVPSGKARLQIVQERGKLICGTNGSLPGFSYLDPATNQMSGLDADICKAVAAAVLGDATKVEWRTLSTKERSVALQTGEIDMLARNTTWTSSRDATWGLFVPTTFYDGQTVMVRKSLNATKLEDLAGASICVQTGTTTELNLTDQMRARNVEFTPVVFEDIDATYAAYDEGRCDAITSDRSQLISRRTVLKNPDDNLIMDVVMSKEPLGPAVPLGDDQWFNVVRWTVFVLIQAEESGITSENVDTFKDTQNPEIRRLLGIEGDLGTQMGLKNDWVGPVIKQVGNYGEIFQRNLGPGTPFNLERGLNDLWTNGGLLYAPPYR